MAIEIRFDAERAARYWRDDTLGSCRSGFGYNLA
jgi:hypothetical protein